MKLRVLPATSLSASFGTMPCQAFLLPANPASCKIADLRRCGLAPLAVHAFAKLALLLALSTAGLPFLAVAQQPLSRAEASLFLEQSTWGPGPQSIQHLVTVGKEQFLDEQFKAEPTRYPEPADREVNLGPYQKMFYRNAMHAPDQLRQRVAFALGQILVVSGSTLGRAHQMVPYWHMLSEESFGNYGVLLQRLATNPTMGRYLDHVNNVKADPKKGTLPNENFAREFLQLFSIGPVLLNPDGTPQRDSAGNLKPAYTEENVKQLAKAFTGWVYAPMPGETPKRRATAYFAEPMIPWEADHDQTEKELLNGYRMPAGRTAREDLEDAVKHVYSHPNIGPFLVVRLIRSLVTSNPSSAYVRNVVAVFDDNGAGVRGDMKAVLRAILLHPEASIRSAGGRTSWTAHGHLTEPVLFVLRVLRALDANVDDANTLNTHSNRMGQNLFYPPSVFNYYHFDNQIDGGYFAPEMELHTTYSAIERANYVAVVVDKRYGDGVSANPEDLLAMATNPAQLVDELSIRLTHGSLPANAKAAIVQFTSGVTDPAARLQRALYLVANSPYAWVSGGAPLPSAERGQGRQPRVPVGLPAPPSSRGANERN